MAKDEATSRSKIPVFDIHQASFLEHNGITPKLTLQGTRVIFEFDASEIVYKFLRDYQNNPSIPILDYVNVLRRLRSRMLSMRG